MKHLYRALPLAAALLAACKERTSPQPAAPAKPEMKKKDPEPPPRDPEMERAAEMEIEEQFAEILLDSVAQALLFAVHNARNDRAVLTHDLECDQALGRYEFPLPRLADREGVHFPGGERLRSWEILAPEELPSFRLGGDPWIRSELERIGGSDPCREFEFSFDVRRVNTFAHLVGTPDPFGGIYRLESFEAMTAVFEFRIWVLRKSKFVAFSSIRIRLP